METSSGKICQQETRPQSLPPTECNKVNPKLDLRHKLCRRAALLIQQQGNIFPGERKVYDLYINSSELVMGEGSQRQNSNTIANIAQLEKN